MCNLNECLVLKIRIGREKCFFSCLYRSPSQGREEFKSFCTDFDLFSSNINDLSPVCFIINGDFNARSTKWWKLDKENFEGREINIITRAVGYSQLMNQPKHITKDSLSCIDLIFTSNPDLNNSSGVEMSLFEKCHHNIVHGKIDILNECLKNIFHNFVPKKVIKCDYRQSPWMTDSKKIN